MKETCPLCKSSDYTDYHRDKRRRYLNCSRCDLVFVPSQYHTDREEEKRIYDLHENDPHDPGYRRFLSRLCDPLVERLDRDARGLDFGCGPGPALALMLEEKGHGMSLYDLYYFDNKEVLREPYDFITATEVVEHLRNPADVFKRLFGSLNEGGWLAIMTKLVIDRNAFSRWHYIQDQTHICFFSKRTFEFLAKQYRCELQFIDKDVIFLRKDNS